ncbi:MAG TPA: type II toxin-antitoxin system VapC family toxin [Candidatus Limnocylindrales bacterium]|jgi:predicted nucleic acid-binding protein|nr:type II toxin-antitoxin system VapC family toxin [Candidatus Limnocylindrales bacterium]
MSGFLLDTNCISELVRIKPEPRVVEWVLAADEKLLHVSVLAFGEIRKGVTLLPAGKKRDQLEQWLESELPARFANRLLPINGAIAEIWGAMAGQAQLKGITLAIIDGLMAATAKHHDLTVVTRNVKDFSVWGIPVTNPWGTTWIPT